MGPLWLCRCIMTVDITDISVWVVQGFKPTVYDICAYVSCFNVTSCSCSPGGLQVKGALTLIWLRMCKPDSEFKVTGWVSLSWLPRVRSWCAGFYLWLFIKTRRKCIRLSLCNNHLTGFSSHSFHDLCHKNTEETWDAGNDPWQRYPRVIYHSGQASLVHETPFNLWLNAREWKSLS